MKAGHVLTAKEAKAIAQAGGRVWLQMESHDPDDESYDGPVTFEQVPGGYLLNADGVSEDDATMDFDTGLFDDIDPSVTGVSFPVTDITFGDYEDNQRLSEDFGAGRMRICAIED